MKVKEIRIFNYEYRMSSTPTITLQETLKEDLPDDEEIAKLADEIERLKKNGASPEEITDLELRLTGMKLAADQSQAAEYEQPDAALTDSPLTPDSPFDLNASQGHAAGQIANQENLRIQLSYVQRRVDQRNLSDDRAELLLIRIERELLSRTDTDPHLTPSLT